MSSLAEIQEAIEKLASEDRARLREWFDAQDFEETDELLVAIDEGIRSAETEGTFSLEEVRGHGARGTPRLALADSIVLLFSESLVVPGFRQTRRISRIGRY